MSSAKHSRERETAFNIILVGNSGTGKSASANTILKAGKRQRSSSQYFLSNPSSIPVTTKCKGIVVEMFGSQFRVVDTPDFFYGDKCVEKTQVEECKKYCKSRQHVMLLVMQLGRFTDGERGILEKLENSFGSRIKENTIVLFTHGEDLRCDVKRFIGERSHLRHIVEACGNRYHIFKNTSSDPKQVKALFERFYYMFPNFNIKQSSLFCCG